MSGLDKVAKGMGLVGKRPGIDGSRAPALWNQGQFETVLEYCSQDVVATYEVADVLCGSGWGSHCEDWIFQEPRTVAQCLEMPRVEGRWEPSKFLGWLEVSDGQARS